MRLFDPQNATASPEHRRLYSVYSTAINVINFLAAAMFVVGSIAFFYPSANLLACWMFLFGSIFFAVSPTVALIREIRLRQLLPRGTTRESPAS